MVEFAARRIAPRRQPRSSHAQHELAEPAQHRRPYAGIPGGKAVEGDAAIKAEVDHIEGNKQGTLRDGGNLKGYGTFALVEQTNGTWLMLARAENSNRVAHAVFQQKPTDLRYFATPLIGCSERYPSIAPEKLREDWTPMPLSRAHEKLEQRLAALRSGSVGEAYYRDDASSGSRMNTHAARTDIPKGDLRTVVIMDKESGLWSILVDRNSSGDADIIVSNPRRNVHIRDIKLRGITGPWDRLLQQPSEKYREGSELYQTLKKVIELRLAGNYFTPADMKNSPYTLDEFRGFLGQMGHATRTMNIPAEAVQTLSSLNMTAHEGKAEPGAIPNQASRAIARA